MTRRIALFAACLAAACDGTTAPGALAAPADAAAPGSEASVDAGGLARPWNHNEVSILFPRVVDPGRLLEMRVQTTSGPRVLLPGSLFRRLGDAATGLPRLVEGAGNRDIYPDLRVVSARVDPCFDGPDPKTGACVRQLRLVAQALDPSDGTLSDAAIHLFYQLEEARFIDTLARLRALSRRTPVAGALGVHPVLSREMLAGAFSDEVRAIIASACSEENLTRFTFMATGRSKNWFFFILDRQPDGAFVQKTIPGRGDSDSFTDQGTTAFRMGSPFDVPWFPDALTVTASTRALDEAAFGTAYDQLARLANPRMTHTRDVSCGACHAAESTQREALQDRARSAPPLTPSGYATPRLVPSTGPLRLGNMHAFSYFFDVPTVSERTISESEEVVGYLSSPAFVGTLSPADRAKLE